MPNPKPGGKTMKVYAAALIQKSLHIENQKLQKRLTTELQKALKISTKKVNAKELNTFIFLSAEKPLSDALSPKIVERVEKSGLRSLFARYYLKNKVELQKQLHKKQELKETSKIVKTFLAEVDPKIAKAFEAELKKVRSDLPVEFCEIQAKSYVALWDLEETPKYRLLLPAFADDALACDCFESKADLVSVVDKLVLLNLFKAILEPTINRLQQASDALDALNLNVQTAKHKAQNAKLQEKFEACLRILSAKLSALHDVDKTLLRTLNLFGDLKQDLRGYPLKTDTADLNTEIRQLSTKITSTKRLLATVGKKLSQNQVQLRDYFQNSPNIQTATSADEFKAAVAPIAQLSIDVFVQAELLKMWSDFFGADLPYFTFNTRLYDSEVTTITDAPQDALISVRGLVKNYTLGLTTVYALCGVNLDVKKGEFLAIVGNSGAGKTTLLNCIAGLDTPDYGMVSFRGKNLHKLGDKEKSRIRLMEMGFIFQNYALLPHFTAAENIALPADLAGLSKDLKSRLEELLAGVGISQQAKQFPAQLSGGQMQRVAIARALTNRPAVIFADEPTGDLDSATGKQVMTLLKKFHEETATTIILITHEQDIADYAQRQIIMQDGTIKTRTKQAP
ncbi:MAG: ABC transporter ATP-binding protein [Candidatus Bathyarchaeota archaeon]|nr:ABC transporter ATP-binding protein [Candidatus Bathyarchaeota archaeon]